MPTYKVFGDKVVSYHTNVDAASPEDAWDIAAEQETHKWDQLESDSTIEVHFVELVEDTTNLLEDGYPSMENEILVMDKSDISE